MPHSRAFFPSSLSNLPQICGHISTHSLFIAELATSFYILEILPLIYSRYSQMHFQINHSMSFGFKQNNEGSQVTNAHSSAPPKKSEIWKEKIAGFVVGNNEKVLGT